MSYLIENEVDGCVGAVSAHVVLVVSPIHKNFETSDEILEAEIDAQRFNMPENVFHALDELSIPDERSTVLGRERLQKALAYFFHIAPRFGC